MDTTLEQWVDELQNADAAARTDGVVRLRKLAAAAVSAKNHDEALRFSRLGKSLRIPCSGLDQLRALAFILRGSLPDAIEALKEELRYFPDNQHAESMLKELVRHVPTASDISLDDPAFAQLFAHISPYTMVGLPRLQSLYHHAQSICQQGVAGAFVECGVAGGGSSGLLASMLHRCDMSGRKLFCCDSFTGMPPATEHDVHEGVHAETTGWGSGTCAAPESSVISLCTTLGVLDRIEIVKGYFEETLPVWKEQIGPIAFLHMDGDWYASTKAILENLYDLLVPGAYVQIDDYGYWEGCRKAVHEFLDTRNISVDIVPIDATGAYFYHK